MNWRILALCLVASVTNNIAGTIAKSIRDSDGDTTTEDVYGDCKDVVIVGAGVGGTFMAYHLRNHGLNIGLYEYSDRIGGRLFSPKIPTVEGTSVELGGMRIKPKYHKLFVKTIDAVGLKTVDFPLNNGNPNETLYYLRGQYLRTEDLGGPKTPYILRKSEQLSPGKLMWKLFSENTNMSKTSYPSEKEIYEIYTHDGTPLYTMTLDQFLSRYASREAYHYLADAMVWQHAGREFAAQIGITFLEFPSDAGCATNYVTVKGGMDRVPKNLHKQFLQASGKHSFDRNHQLMSITHKPKGYILDFRRTVTKDGYTKPSGKANIKVCAKKVVLAVQKDVLKYVNFKPLETNAMYKEMSEAVISTSAEKIFLAYETQWWKKGNKNITHVRSTLPTTFTYDWRQGSDGNWIHLPSYSDNPQNIRLWRQLQNRGDVISGSLPGAQRVTTEVRDQIHRFMSEAYDIPFKDIPPTIGGVMQLWDTYPFEAGWHMYRPGFKMGETMNAMIKPLDKHDVFLVTGSWFPNELQGWVEAVLTVANKALDAYFPKSTI